MKHLLVALCFTLAACHRSNQPRCETCAMQLDVNDAFHVELEGPDGHHDYDTPRCAFAGLAKHPGATMWLREYYNQDRRPAGELRFVEHSDVLGPMGPELVPVDPARLTQFVTAHGGGRIGSFDETAARYAKGDVSP